MPFLAIMFCKNKLVVTQQSSPAMAERRLSFYFSSGCLATHPFFFLCIVTTAFVNEDCNHKKGDYCGPRIFQSLFSLYPLKQFKIQLHNLD